MAPLNDSMFLEPEGDKIRSSLQNRNGQTVYFEGYAFNLFIVDSP